MEGSLTQRRTCRSDSRPAGERKIAACRNCGLTLALLLILSAAMSNAGSPPTLQERKERILAREKNVSFEAMQRKERSESVLCSQGVPINKYLPVIETQKEAKRRSKEAVAYRALALLVVALKGEGLEQPSVEQIVNDCGLAPHFSPKEMAFMRNPSPTQHDKVQFLWRYEAAWTLLWALGYIEELGKPTAICDVPRAVKLMPEGSPKKFIADAKLRPLAEILDQADLIYRYHWATRQARINNRPAPAGLDPDVTQERHYALNWLIGYMDQDWDDISTDT